MSNLRLTVAFAVVVVEEEEEEEFYLSQSASMRR
jgi:hypothetical protein